MVSTEQHMERIEKPLILSTTHNSGSYHPVGRKECHAGIG
jgi:hypothetical protein